MAKQENAPKTDRVNTQGHRRRKRVIGLLVLALLTSTVVIALRVRQQFQKNDALASAVQANDLDEVLAMLRQGADPNSQLVYRTTPQTLEETAQWIIGTRRFVWRSTPVLAVASTNGNAQIADTLITQGADIDQTSGDGWTALMTAAGAGHSEVVRLLLRKRVAINARNLYGITALTVARMNTRQEVVQLLTQAGAHE